MMFRTLTIALAAAGMAHGQEAIVQDGEDLFATYCWQCHGTDAKGGGPMAEMLAITPPDLTQLAQRNDGDFPVRAVARHIDGRNPLLAHGGEMPIFGPMLEADQQIALRMPSGQLMMTGLPLANVIVYLQALQE